MIMEQPCCLFPTFRPFFRTCRGGRAPSRKAYVKALNFFQNIIPLKFFEDFFSPAKVVGGFLQAVFNYLMTSSTAVATL